MIGVVIALSLPVLASYGLFALDRRRRRLAGRGLSRWFVVFMSLVFLLYLFLCFAIFFLSGSNRWVA